MHTLAHCCLQSVCCAPGSEEQIAELTANLEDGWKIAAKGFREAPDASAPDVPAPPKDYFRVMAVHLLSENAITSREIGAAIHQTFGEALALHRAHSASG